MEFSSPSHRGPVRFGVVRPRPSTIVLLVLAVIVLACGSPRRASSPPPPSSEPVLGISAVPRLQPPPALQDYLDAAALVRDAGARASFESATWSDLDTPGGRAKLTDAVGSAAGRGNAVLLTIKVLDTTVKAVPSDLVGSTFDSAAMMGRFHGLLSDLQPGLAGKLRYLSIGNEVDVYLAAHTEALEPYRRFLADAVAYAHQLFPGVLVGVTSTYDGARRVSTLNDLTDVVVLTYYPLGPRFVPRPPSTAAPDLAAMLEIAGDRPLVLQEVGYPSDPVLSSSEQRQAEFVTAILAAWKAAGSRVPMLNWFALHDFTPQLCAQLSGYYGLGGDRNFGAYLCSIGLRRVDGTPKPSWQALLGR
jgi:hypothetical protein